MPFPENLAAFTGIMNRQIVVTGGTGFLGNNLIRQLLAQGEHVRAVVRPGTGGHVFEGLDVELIEGQLDDARLLERVLAGADAVIHAAGLVWFGKTQRDASFHVNVELTRAVAAAALQHRVRLIHISSVDALEAAATPDQLLDETHWFQPKSPAVYVQTKRAAERDMLEFVRQGLDGVIINPGFMLGPWDWKPSSGQMIQAVARNVVPFAPGGGCSALDVRDASRAIIAAIDRGRTGERYILGGHNLTYLELWKLFASRTSRSFPKWALPGTMATAVGLLGDLPRWLFGWEGPVNSAAIRISQQYSYYRSDKARRELGYEIGPLERAIDDAVAWLKEREML